MGAIIARQPNGKLCRYSSIVDNITDYNLTDEDYIELCAERARDEARETLKHRLRPFERIVEEMEHSINIGITDKSSWEELLSIMSSNPEPCRVSTDSVISKLWNNFTKGGSESM